MSGTRNHEKLFDVGGKIALVTGSTRGLGYVLARGLGMAGAAVVINGRDRSRLDASVARLREEGLSVSGYCFDITDAEQIEAQVTRMERDVGTIDILLNNAGINKRGPLAELSERTWREVIDIDLTGAFLVSRRVVRGMIARKEGKIINICSLLSELGRATVAPYCAAKGGLKMLTRTMVVEWAGHNIQVNGIGPGYFHTEMTEPLARDKEFDSWLKSRTPAARWGDPSELVGTALYLASPASSFVNGQVIYVDGGMLASL